MAYHVTREFYPHGIEGEQTDCTFKEFATLDKAIAYCNRYSVGLRFVRATVEDDNGDEKYELLNNGDVFIDGSIDAVEYVYTD